MTLHKVLIGSLLIAAFMQTSPPAGAMGGSRGPELLVVPAYYSPLQVAFDVLATRNAVLVGYQGGPASENPALYVWDGVEWLSISKDAFQMTSFLSSPPSRIVLVGDTDTLPSVLIDAATSGLTSNVIRIPVQDTASLVNALGSAFSFRKSEWSWFATRYGLDLDDLNADLRETSWYDQPYVGRPTYPWKRSAPVAVTGAAMDDDSDIPAANVVEGTVWAEPAADPTATTWNDLSDLEKEAMATEAPIK